jgi:hypothetical protein
MVGFGSNPTLFVLVAAEAAARLMSLKRHGHPDRHSIRHPGARRGPGESTEWDPGVRRDDEDFNLRPRGPAACY